MRFISGAVLLTVSALAVSSPSRAQQAAAPASSLEFSARITPSSGVDEPVRGFPFYLLNKSFASIRKEVRSDSPAPDMDAFIAGLHVSPELKSWMKKNHWVRLSGEQFLHMLKPDDVLGISEFRTAYLERNEGDLSNGFPQPRYKPAEEKKNPAQYQKRKAEYEQALHDYLAAHPESKEGMDGDLGDSDPESQWNELLIKHEREIRVGALDLARSRYLVAKVETDLNGAAGLQGIRPGGYWLSTLDLPATVGDVRARWDVPVQIEPGKTTRVSLSNANAVQPSAAAK